MSDESYIRYLLDQQALGDQVATAELARLLAGAQQQQSQQEVQQVHAFYQSRERFRAKVEAKAQEYPFLNRNNDPEAFEFAQDLDMKLFKKFPNMSEDDRLQKVAEATYERMGDPEDRDYSNVIETMRDSRNPQLKVSESDYESERDPVGDEEEAMASDRSSVVADMIEQRRIQQQLAGSRSREPVERPKPRRAFEFPG